jgi:hypothetical protein
MLFCCSKCYDECNGVGKALRRDDVAQTTLSGVEIKNRIKELEKRQKELENL